MKTTRLRLSLAFAVLPWISLPAARAASLNWDPAAGSGTTLGGSGNFTNTATDLFWWNGTADVSWTDTLGVDTAILNITPTPDPLPDPGIFNLNTVTIPTGTTIVGNGLTYAINGYTVAGPGGFNFRNNTTTAAAPATITVPAGITGTFSAANNQNGGTLPNITITGGGTLRWNPPGNGTRITIEGGTLVDCFGGNQSLGGGTNNINNGTFRWSASGAADLFYNSANFAGPLAAGTPSGKIDINGRTEVIGSIAGNFNITNQGTAPATLILSGGGAVTYTGVISDHPSDPAVTTGLTLTGTNVASGTNFSSVGNVLTQTIGKPQTFTGNTTLQRGTLSLDFNNAANAGTADLLYNSVPAFIPGSGFSGLIFATNPATGAEVGTGGRTVLNLIGKLNTAITQRFNGLTLLANSAGGLNFTQPTGGTAATTTATISLGNISRATGSSFNVSNVGTVNGLTVNTPTGTANQIIEENGVPWMTIAGSDWAAKDPTNAFLVPATYTAAGTTSLSDHSTSVAGADVRLLADTTIRSYRHNLNERRTVDLNGRTLTTGAILIGSTVGISGSSFTGGQLTAAGQDLLLVQTAAANFRYFGIGSNLTDNPAGPVGFTKSGTGSSLLTGKNSNTGNLAVNQGVLILTGINTPASVLIHGNTANTNGGQLPVNSTTVNMLQLGNGDTTGSLAETSVTGAVPITISALAALAVKRSDDVVISNQILGAGNFIQAGTGTVILDGPVANYGWRGDTIVSAGVLNLDYNANNSGKISDLSILRMGGGIARMSGGSHTEVLSSLTLTSGLSRIETAEGSTGRFRLNTLNGIGSTTAAGTAGGALNVADSSIADTDTTNTLGILGAVARITVGGLDWAVNSTNAGDGIVVPYAGYTPLATTAGTDTANSQSLAAATTLTGSRTTNTLRLSSAGGAATFDIGTGNTLTLTGGGLLLTGNNAVTLNNGTLRSGTAVSPELIIHNYAGQPVTINSALGFGVSATTGQTHVNLSGPGTTILAGTNNYGGVTYVNGGTAVVTSGANLGGANGIINVASSLITSPAVTLASATLPVGFGPGSRLLGQTVNSISGVTVTLGGNATAAIASPGGTASWATANSIILNRATLKVDGTFSLTQSNAAGAAGGTMTLNLTTTVNGSGGTIEVTGSNILTVAGNTNGPGALTKTGPGTLLYTTGSANSATGPTIVQEGTIRAGISTALSFYSNYTVGALGTIDLAGVATTNTNQTVGSLSGAGTITNSGTGPSTLNVGSIFKSTVFSGLIQNGTATTALTKIGTGSLTLSNANTYSGATTVEAGGLIANNTSGSATGPSTITIRSTGFLAGTGSVAGNVTLSGTLSPGDPNAADTTDDLELTGNVTCNANSGLLFEIGGTAPGTYDQIKVTGTLGLSSLQDVTLKLLSGYTPAAGHSFALATAGTLTAPDVAFTLPALPAGLAWNTSSFGSNGSVSITSAATNLYNAWLNTYFTSAEQQNPALSGPGADADTDGLANAIEFAAGTLPRNAASGGSAALPVLSVTPVSGLDYATLTFIANTANLPGITVSGQSGTTLGTWPDALPLLSSTVNGNGTTTLVFRSTTATNVPVRRFYRLNLLPVP